MLKLFKFPGKKTQDKYVSSENTNNFEPDVASMASLTQQLTEAEKISYTSKEISIIKIQSTVRRYLAIRKIKTRTEHIWERVYDARADRYFWFNKMSGVSQWHVPRLLKLHSAVDHAAARHIQRIVRGYLGRIRTMKLVGNLSSFLFQYTLLLNLLSRTNWIIKHSVRDLTVGFTTDCIVFAVAKETTSSILIISVSCKIIAKTNSFLLY